MKGSLSCSRTKLEVVRTSEVHPRIMNIMKIGAALALAAVKVSSWLESSSEGNVESGFPSCGGDRSRKCKLAANGRESQPPRQTRDTRGCNDADCSWMMCVPERRCGAPCSTRGFVCRGNSRPPRANKRDERRRLRPSRLGVRSRRAHRPPRHQARVWPGTFVVLRGEEGRGHGGSDG